MINDLSRRDFLSRAGGAVSAVWLSAHWPAIVAAAEHAHQAAKSSSPQKFQFFTPEEGVEIDAITARIIPSDGTPGAHEAGVVYFIDRALTTFALDDQKTYRDGLPELQAQTREILPALENFSAATSAQQDEILHSFDEDQLAERLARPRAAAKKFFE